MESTWAEGSATTRKNINIRDYQDLMTLNVTLNDTTVDTSRSSSRYENLKRSNRQSNQPSDNKISTHGSATKNNDNYEPTSIGVFLPQIGRIGKVKKETPLIKLPNNQTQVRYLQKCCDCIKHDVINQNSEYIYI